MGTLVSIHNLTKQKAEQKSDEMYKISRIGLYADGNTDNSSFDLIKDLQDIDAVIFTEELDYFGETPMDNDFF
ncbi:MAG: hypothetical protein H6767_10060 [Candidatus Peribacteria bacterium]|nr:MAG: hypothetical protein H6767_10060 [Candidatus Peribacteria bacterium]